MFKKLGLVFVWFLVTPTVLVGAIAYLYQQSQIDNFLKNAPVTNTIQTNSHIEGQVLGTRIDDMRPYLVSNFLQNTALEPYSEYMVSTSDKYGIDWRLIPAIAMKESTGGNATRVGSFNAWGFENGRTNFDSWESAIDKVAKTLRVHYIDKGLVTPEEIMVVYAPPQLLNGGKWARDINLFFSRMQSL